MQWLARRRKPSAQAAPHTRAQIGKQFVREPLILVQPRVVAPRRMRQRYIAWTVIPPSAYGFRHARFFPAIEVPVLRMETHQQGKFERRQSLKKPCAPVRQAFLARWLVTAVL